jgi:hypothetical protein
MWAAWRALARLGLALDTSFLQGYRHQSGFLNGSALPARFIDRNGTLLDCWEQSTVLGDDTLVTTKTMLPVKSEQECINLSLQLIRELAMCYHSVFHPYFHPVNVGGRGRIHTVRWLEEVLQEGARLGMPAPSCDQWLAFTRARRTASIEDLRWDEAACRLSFRLCGALPVEALTVIVPDLAEGDTRITVNSPPVAPAQIAGDRTLCGFCTDIDPDLESSIVVEYRHNG